MMPHYIWLLSGERNEPKGRKCLIIWVSDNERSVWYQANLKLEHRCQIKIVIV